MFEFTDKHFYTDLYSFTVLTVVAETNISTESDLG